MIRSMFGSSEEIDGTIRKKSQQGRIRAQEFDWLR
jgi:hypothetical protein